MNIGQPSKFSAAGREFPYVIEYGQVVKNGDNSTPESITRRTYQRPRTTLIKKMGEIAKLGLRLQGLGLIVENIERRQLLTFTAGSVEAEVTDMLLPDMALAFATITWTEGDHPGSRIEVVVITQSLGKSSSRVGTRIKLPKVDDTEETEWIGEGKDKQLVPVEGSLKNDYIAAVKELRDLVHGFAEGQSDQLNLDLQPDVESEHAEAAAH